MKTIIQSYTPQECERIINGRQTIKVCKTAPKDTPFKVYIYCTKTSMTKYPSMYSYLHINSGQAVKKYGKIETWGKIGDVVVNAHRPDSKYISYGCGGNVIGEYVCKKVDVAEVRGKLLGLYNSRFVDASDFSLIVKRYLDNSELSNYGRGKSISCLHISNVKIYDKPKELSEFNLTLPPHGWQYVEEEE